MMVATHTLTHNPPSPGARVVLDGRGANPPSVYGNKTARTAWLQQQVDLAVEHGLDGINFDMVRMLLLLLCLHALHMLLAHAHKYTKSHTNTIIVNVVTTRIQATLKREEKGGENTHTGGPPGSRRPPGPRIHHPHTRSICSLSCSTSS